MLVLAISVQSVPLVENCHLVMLPVWPDKVRVPLVLPEQMVVPPDTEPATVDGSTVTVTPVASAPLQA